MIYKIHRVTIERDVYDEVDKCELPIKLEFLPYTIYDKSLKILTTFVVRQNRITKTKTKKVIQCRRIVEGRIKTSKGEDRYIEVNSPERVNNRTGLIVTPYTYRRHLGNIYGETSRIKFIEDIKKALVKI